MKVLRYPSFFMSCTQGLIDWATRYTDKNVMATGIMLIMYIRNHVPTVSQAAAALDGGLKRVF